MKYKILLFFMCFSFTTFAQYTFEGEVIDKNGEVLVGATVLEEGTENYTLTDIEGEFTLNGDSPEINVIISYLGEPIKKLLRADEYASISISNTDKSIAPVFISEKYPVTETTVSSEQLQSVNLGQDIPILLEQLPSVVSTSDAGAGIGYSGIRVRGSDASRVNVTINGVPLNDSESQGVFWVNMPDFASSTDKITLVRGVGTSTNGAGAFGASLHLETEDNSKEAYAEYNGGYGSFNTWRNNIKLGTGLHNGWSANARLSKITSDGFIDRASSDLQSYFVQAKKQFGNDISKKGEVKFITFKGQEETYQAWFGVREDILATNRTFNPYTYENQVDNYGQEHFQLIYNQNFSENLSTNLALHYTKGAGYFEEFRAEDNLSDYGITSGFSETSDLVRRRWLDNDFFGFVTSMNWEKAAHFLNIGGGYNQYLGDHFGEVIQGEFVAQEFIGENYYFNDADKKDGNIYAKYTYDIENIGEYGLLRPFIDLQFRSVSYAFVGLALDGNGDVQELPQKENLNFFNPKAGISYENGNHGAYFSFSRAQKEPNRSDYIDSPANQLPVPEELNDYELGYSFYSPNNRFTAGINGYFMDYKNQLATTGGVNDVGQYTRVNVPDSYRAGVELEASVNFKNNIYLLGNATFSKNKIDSFTENLELYDDNGFLGFQEINHENTDLALSPNTIASAIMGWKTKSNVLDVKVINKYVGSQFLDNTSTDSRSIDAYFVNNFNASLDLSEFIPQLSSLQLNLLVNNVFDQEYESNGYTFGYGYNGTPFYENYYYPQAGTNVLTGLKIRF